MDADARKRIQISFLLVFVLVLARLGYVFYERSQPGVERKKEVPQASYKPTSDDYVTPKKLFPYDLKSAREFTGKTAWSRTGYQLPYYRYMPGSRSVDSKHPAGTLGPLEKLEVSDVVLQRSSGRNQLMAVFTRLGEKAQYVSSIGTEDGGTF